MASFRHAVGRVPGVRRMRNALFAAPPAPPASAPASDAALDQARLEGRLIVTEYAYHPRSRPIEVSAGGRRLAARFSAEEERYAEVLRGVARHAEALLRVPRAEANPQRPFWANDWFPPFDGIVLYGLLAERKPVRCVEVGSGISTRFARQAIRDLGLSTRIISIDPHPHTAIAANCDEVIQSRMEDMPESFWAGIGPEDMLFVDNSHRSFPASDVTVFFTEILPALASGTVWGQHDILLPRDYPDAWGYRFYSEQYLLMAYLLGGAGGDEILLPVSWATLRPSLHGILGKLWARDDLFAGVGTHGSSFWMRRA